MGMNKSYKYILHATFWESLDEIKKTNKFLYENWRATITPDLQVAYNFATKWWPQEKDHNPEKYRREILILEPTKEAIINTCYRWYIDIDDKSKIISWYSGRRQSGISQSAFYSSQLMEAERKTVIRDKNITHIDQLEQQSCINLQSILSIQISLAIWSLVDDLKKKVKKCTWIERWKYINKLVPLITWEIPDEQKKIIAEEIIHTTITSIMMRYMRDLFLQVKVLSWYTIYNRNDDVEQDIEETMDTSDTKERIEYLCKEIQNPLFDMWDEQLNKYIKNSVNTLYKELQKVKM